MASSGYVDSEEHVEYVSLRVLRYGTPYACDPLNLYLA
jgi:hypothetical protein